MEKQLIFYRLLDLLFQIIVLLLSRYLRLSFLVLLQRPTTKNLVLLGMNTIDLILI
nr:MAG TPA: hypothetical protein [Caudoviricetes sp.]